VISNDNNREELLITCPHLNIEVQRFDIVYDLSIKIISPKFLKSPCLKKNVVTVNDKSYTSFVLGAMYISLRRRKSWHKIQEFWDSVFRTTLDSDLFGILCEIIKNKMRCAICTYRFKNKLSNFIDIWYCFLHVYIWVCVCIYMCVHTYAYTHIYTLRQCLCSWGIYFKRYL